MKFNKMTKKVVVTLITILMMTITYPITAEHEIESIDDQPELEIEIQSGFGMRVGVIIKNKGDADAHRVAYSISIVGGVLGLINHSKSTDLMTSVWISAGSSRTIYSGIFIGIGPIDIHVKASCSEGASAEANGSGKQILIFSVVN